MILLVKNTSSRIAILLLYIDNMVTTGKIRAYKNHLKKTIWNDDVKQLTYCLGTKVVYSDRRYHLS